MVSLIWSMKTDKRNPELGKNYLITHRWRVYIDWKGMGSEGKMDLKGDGLTELEFAKLSFKIF